MARLTCIGGSAGDKGSPLVEHFYKTQAKATIDRKRYFYWLFMDITGVCGVIVYCDITKTSATLHVQAPGLLRKRNVIRFMFDYPFNQLGVQKLFAPISSANEVAQRNALKLGFRLEGTAKDYHDKGNDLLLFSYARSDIARWIGSRNDQQDFSLVA